MNPLNSIIGTIATGLIISVAIAFAIEPSGLDSGALVLWIHVGAGITWIGLLYYFNFVQVPALGEAANDEGGPGGGGIIKYVAPRALLWFRWAAIVTWLAGAMMLMANKQLIAVFTLGASGTVIPSYTLIIGIGAWLGTIMLFNVWVLIWPNQKKVLGLVEASADEIGRAKKIALMASRTNTMLSFPMLMCMLGAPHGLIM